MLISITYLLQESIRKKYKFFFDIKEQLEKISNFLIKDAPNVTDISYMFYNCIELKNLPEKLGFNENIITDISYMFYNTK